MMELSDRSAGNVLIVRVYRCYVNDPTRKFSVSFALISIKGSQIGKILDFTRRERAYFERQGYKKLFSSSSSIKLEDITI